MTPSSDTIVALSTPRGYSGIGVIRLSGPDAVSMVRKVFKTAGTGDRFPDRAAQYGSVHDPVSGKVLDDGLALVMRGPASYTGEDVVELSLHGSPVVLDLVERILVSLGARPAARGEFTRRAFLSGRMDLLQAEAVIDLIEAASPSAVEEARARLDRSLSSEICRISSAVKDLLAEMEAHIDFDEDDVESLPDPAPALTSLVTCMDDLIRQAESGRMRRQGLRTVIVGKPNVGKSTLFNALLRADRAIVTPHPGTTRDTIDERIVLSGHAFVLCDTAGIREDPEPVEAEGILRTRSLMSAADITIVVLDRSSLLEPEDLDVLASAKDDRTILVLNKTDRGTLLDSESDRLAPSSLPRVYMSAKTGQGLAELERLLCQEAERVSTDKERHAPGSLTHRGVVLMESAKMPLLTLLDRFNLHETVEPEIISLELRRCLEPLEEITGERVDEGILDRIFERFCVGK
jgi:tRNA modification GTPase